MTKKLNSAAITNELEESAFFPGSRSRQDAPPAPASSPPVAVPPAAKRPPPPPPLTQARGTVIPRHHDTKQGNEEAEAEMCQRVRQAVKQIGKESATQRLTLAEKQALLEIEYTYKRQGVRTSGNEIIRIATNYLIEDYKRNGETSILAKILTLLNS